MEDNHLNVNIGSITVSVKMEDEGILLNIIKKSSPIGFAPIEEEVIESASKKYSELGFEVKEIHEE
jgi:methenyltetrahydromethanopterin cyclohydrolase|tara:strand:+ start:792 stop:989 length:198 start_codon:yes stop_codon:yes gene_type:complete